MTLAKAVRLAVATMRAECKRLAFDANLCDRLGLKEPGAVKASKRRRELLAAVDALRVGVLAGGAKRKV